MKACGACSLTPVLALVGLVGLGVGGYNWVSTGCPLGGCHGDSASKITTISTNPTVKEGDCPLCPGHSETTLVKTESSDCAAAHDCSAEAKGDGSCCQKMAEEKKEASEAAKPDGPAAEQTKADKTDAKPATKPS